MPSATVNPVTPTPSNTFNQDTPDTEATPSSQGRYIDNLIDRHELKEATDELDAKSKQFKTVPISDLSLKEVVKCLKLEFDLKDTEMKDVQPLPLPPHLVSTLGLIEKAFGRSRINEASARWITNMQAELNTPEAQHILSLHEEVPRGHGDFNDMASDMAQRLALRDDRQGRMLKAALDSVRAAYAEAYGPTESDEEREQ